MSTHALIIAKLSNSVYGSIHLQYDGYEEHAGRILNTHYNNQTKIDALIALGDISTIGYDPVIRKTDKAPSDMYCESYHFDRNEPWESCKYSLSVSLDKIKEMYGADEYEYVYIWGGESWTCEKN